MTTISVTSSAPCRSLDPTKSGIFYAKPSGRICVDMFQLRIAEYTQTSSMKDLLQFFKKEEGPFVVAAQLAYAYGDMPKPKGMYCGQKVYGWDVNTPRFNLPGKDTYSLVLGAKQLKGRDFVYFVSCKCDFINQENFIIHLSPELPLNGVYCVSHATFNKYLSSVFFLKKESSYLEGKKIFCLSSLPKKVPALSAAEKSYIVAIRSLGTADSILLDGTVRAKCKAIGQEIFDKYKGEEGGTSLKGFAAAQKICNALAFNSDGQKTRDGIVWKSHVEAAWDGIGDSTKRWRR